jgi:hypothetical protein
MQKSWGLKKGPQSFCKVIMLACFIVIAPFKTKKLKIKQTTHMDLWKYGQILTIQKSLTIKWLRFSRKDSSYEFIILYYIIYWVPITNLKCDSI